MERYFESNSSTQCGRNAYCTDNFDTKQLECVCHDGFYRDGDICRSDKVEDPEDMGKFKCLCNSVTYVSVLIIITEWYQNIHKLPLHNGFKKWLFLLFLAKGNGKYMCTYNMWLILIYLLTTAERINYLIDKDSNLIYYFMFLSLQIVYGAAINCTSTFFHAIANLTQLLTTGKKRS